MNEPVPVLADAQFGVMRIIRPVTGFETTYEGVSADSPIYMFEGNKHLDQLAEDQTPGYDPTLARGLSVPMGARVMLWIPNVFWPDTPADSGYEWIIMWRLRNVFDFRQARIPFHFPKQSNGPDDTTVPLGQRERVTIPAAYNTITYIQTEPTAQLGRAIQHTHSEDLEMGTNVLAGPLLPDGTEQAIEQGVFDPSVISDAKRPQWLVHEVQAMGDEMLIAVRRDASAPDTDWAFAGVDERFSQFLGQQFPDVGVYVSVGTAP